jgi:small nuclear ribonucleoprotein (snRNP)-like protein
MTPAGLLCIILGFVLMIVLIMNNLIAQGILMTRDQKINIFLEEFSMMDKEEKARFVNEYYQNVQIKSMCKLFI